MKFREHCHITPMTRGTVYVTQVGFRGQLSHIFEIQLFCCFVAIFDLVDDVETMHCLC